MLCILFMYPIRSILWKMFSFRFPKSYVLCRRLIAPFTIKAQLLRCLHIFSNSLIFPPIFRQHMVKAFSYGVFHGYFSNSFRTYLISGPRRHSNVEVTPHHIWASSVHYKNVDAWIFNSCWFGLGTLSHTCVDASSELYFFEMAILCLWKHPDFL